MEHHFVTSINIATTIIADTEEEAHKELQAFEKVVKRILPLGVEMILEEPGQITGVVKYRVASYMPMPWTMTATPEPREL
jgi:hypothetical protein